MIQKLNKLNNQFIIFAYKKNSSRLSRRIKTAKWNPVDMKNGNPLQVLTDAMTYNATVQINYKNSGWRTILPYGWNSSKDGNILLMCYKDTGEIRSYRVDKIYDLLVNDSLFENMPGDRPDEPAMHMSFNDFKIPTLPNIDEIIDETEAEVEQELPYDAGLQALTDEQVTENYQPVNTVNDEVEDKTLRDEEGNVINTDEDTDNEIANELTDEDEATENEDKDSELEDLSLDEENLDLNFDGINDEDKSKDTEQDADNQDDEFDLEALLNEDNKKK